MVCSHGLQEPNWLIWHYPRKTVLEISKSSARLVIQHNLSHEGYFNNESGPNNVPCSHWGLGQGSKPTKKASIHLIGSIDPRELLQHAMEIGLASLSSKPSQKRTMFETSTPTPHFDYNLTISHHSPLGLEWIRKLNGIVIHKLSDRRDGVFQNHIS